MTRELIFTSVPIGLEPGRSGYCTVARSKDIPKNMVREIEKLSVLDLSQSILSPPKVSSFRIIESGNLIHFLISRTRSAGNDYTNRTNYISHHLIFSSEDISGLPSPSAILDQWTGWKDEWDEQPRYLDSESAYDFSAVSPADSKNLKAWKAWTGDSANAKILVDGHSILRVSPGDETFLLRLYAESCSLLAAPSDAWNLPFTTYLQPMDNAEDFVWIGGWEGSPADKITVGSSIGFIDLDPFDEELLGQDIDKIPDELISVIDEEAVPKETENVPIELPSVDARITETHFEQLEQKGEPTESHIKDEPADAVSISYSASEEIKRTQEPVGQEDHYNSLESEDGILPQTDIINNNNACAQDNDESYLESDGMDDPPAPGVLSEKTISEQVGGMATNGKSSSSHDPRKILLFCLPFATVILFFLAIVFYLVGRINELEIKLSKISQDFESNANPQSDSSRVLNNTPRVNPLSQSIDLTSGLIAYYPFDGNASDMSGNGHHGIVYGANFGEDRYGNLANSMTFDGIDDYIDLGDNPKLDVGSSDFTLATWIRKNSATGIRDILAKRNGNPHHGWVFQIWGTVRLWSEYGSFDTRHPSGLVRSWIHLTVVRNMIDETAELFINGSFANKGSYPGQDLSNSNRLSVGRLSDEDGHYFDGSIDDIRIYNRALSATETRAIYNSEKLTMIEPSSHLNNGLIAYYTFDGDAQDMSGNDRHGRLQGGVIPSRDRHGFPNKSLEFDGKGSHVRIPVLPDMKEISISAWVLMTSNKKGTILCDSTITFANDFLFQVSPNHLSIRGDKGLGELRESFEFQHLPEGWLHLACVVSTRGVTAFSNGSKIGFSNVKGNNIGFHNPEGATIGTADYWGKAKDEPFEGRLDDLRIYGRTLSTNEVQALYKFGQ